MVDYTRFYFRNYSDGERAQDSRPLQVEIKVRRRRRGGRIGALLIVLSFAVTLICVNSLTAGSLVGLFSGGARHVEFFAVRTVGFESVEIAEKYAVSDRGNGGAGVVDCGEEIAVISSVHDTTGAVDTIGKSGSQLVVIRVSEDVSDEYLDVLDLAFARLTAVSSLAECGADGEVLRQAVNICANEIMTALDGTDTGLTDYQSVLALKSGLERLQSSPCASNARAVLVNAVLALPTA